MIRPNLRKYETEWTDEDRDLLTHTLMLQQGKTHKVDFYIVSGVCMLVICAALIVYIGGMLWTLVWKVFG